MTHILRETFRRREKLLEVGMGRQNYTVELHYGFNSKNTYMHVYVHTYIVHSL